MFAAGVRRLVAVAALATMITVAGCSGGTDAAGDRDPALAALEEAAFDEGQLTIYTGAGESQAQALVEAFSDDYPEISVDYFRAAGAALFNRFESEQQAGAATADVFIPTVQPSFVNDHPQWFVPLTDELVPQAVDWPEKFRTEQTVQVAVEEVVAVYNTKAVPEPPTEWEDFLDERYRGRIILVDPESSAGYMSWYSIMRERYGDEFLTRLGELDPLWVDTGAVGAQQVANGGYDVSLPSYPSHAVALQAQQAPIEMIKDLDPTQGLTTNVAITSSAPNPATARLFVNWLMTDNGYRALCADKVYSATTERADCGRLAEHYVEPAWDLPADEQRRIVSLLGR